MSDWCIIAYTTQDTLELFESGLLDVSDVWQSNSHNPAGYSTGTTLLVLDLPYVFRANRDWG